MQQEDTLAASTIETVERFNNAFGRQDVAGCTRSEPRQRRGDSVICDPPVYRVVLRDSKSLGGR